MVIHWAGTAGGGGAQGHWTPGDRKAELVDDQPAAHSLCCAHFLAEPSEKFPFY